MAVKTLRLQPPETLPIKVKYYLEDVEEARVDILAQVQWRYEPATKEDVEKMWAEAPVIYAILSEAASLEEAREKLYEYLSKWEAKLRNGEVDLHPIDYWLAIQAINNFKNILSKRNEKIAKFSTLEYLYRLAKNDPKVYNEVGKGFIEEFKHLFKAIHGTAKFSMGWLGEKFGGEEPILEFLQSRGLKAAKLRSNYLDKVGKFVLDYVERYRSGLDPKVIEERKKNRQKILDYLGATLDDWYFYPWQFRNIFKNMKHLEMLKELVPLTEEDIENIKIALENRIPFGITPYYLSLFDFTRADRKYDPVVRSQVIPPRWYVEVMAKHKRDRRFVFDFMREGDTSPHDLITRRYPLVAIIKVADTCPQICVYCQRNWEIESALFPEGILNMRRIERAIEWMAQHETIIDVLLTGGEPMILGDKRLERILDKLSEVDHIKNIRIGSRILVTVPMRITDETAELLGSYIEPGKRNLAFVTHFEGAEEVTPEVAEAVKKLRKNGVYVYNQQVFRFWTSRRFQYVALRIALKKVGIDPYYNFYPKGKFEQKDFLVPIARIMQERKEEARLLPGIFRTDEPVFNVPALGKNHIRAWQDRELIAVTPKYGNRVYLWHPWEKGIAPITPWPYIDVPIYDYLKRLEEAGEDPKEYETIWYYY
ncbi:MAG: KamA family radical SAM protein [Desulfurococcales archaeon]|nr:KamA family radical SAM protein [Desulfurococcales archaeon]